MCKGPDPYLDVVLKTKRVFSREGGMGIFFFFNYYHYHFNSKEKKKLPSKITSL